jgi:hypothetical protein
MDDLALAKPALRGAPHRARRRQPSSRATGRRSTNSARRPKPAIISRPSGSAPTQANRRAKRSISMADQTTPSPRMAATTRCTSLSASTQKTACICLICGGARHPPPLARVIGKSRTPSRRKRFDLDCRALSDLAFVHTPRADLTCKRLRTVWETSHYVLDGVIRGVR